MGINIILQKTKINNSNIYNIVALKQKKDRMVLSGKIGVINKDLGYVLIDRKKLFNYIRYGATISKCAYKYIDNLNIFKQKKSSINSSKK